MELFKIAVVVMLVAIVASMGSALYHLSSGKGDSRKMARALTIRVGLSVTLFCMLIGAWALGLISPHGLASP